MRTVLAVLVALLLFAAMWVVLIGSVDEPTAKAHAAAVVFPPPTSTTTTSTTAPPTTTSTSMPRSHTTAPIARSSEGVPAVIRAGFARFGAAVAEQAVRVSSCETGGTFNPAAVNGAHAGLFQISRTYHADRVRRLGFTWDQMFTVEPNVAVAADIYAESGWGPWTCRWDA
jgi:hypothetical protein